MPSDATRLRAPRRPVHGVLLLDKPIGLSSNDALQKVKRLFGAEKAGHTGTLDPLATGLLPICFGAATKFSQVNLEADKRYRATLQLGVTTTTGDAEGARVEVRPVAVTRTDLEAACARLTGPIDQIPPMHSALKRDGRPLYDYARAGIELEREPRRVTIHSIGILEADVELHARADAHVPAEGRWTLDVHCSKGTYIRTLAEEIGAALGCGAHLAALRRTRSGSLSLDAALTLEALAVITEPERDAALLPVDALVADWPLIRLDRDDAGRFLTGLRRRLPQLADAAGVRVYGPEPRAFLGGGHVTAGELIPTRLLSPAEVQGVLAHPSSDLLFC